MPPSGRSTVQDHLALAEIELCGELMIAATAVAEGRLSPDRIDEVLDVAPGPRRSSASPAMASYRSAGSEAR